MTHVTQTEGPSPGFFGTVPVLTSGMSARRQPKWHPLRHTEFATIRLRLLKIAGRIIETASRIRIALALCCPEAETFSLVALALKPSGP